MGRIVACNAKGRDAHVGADPDRVWQFGKQRQKQCARAGAEIGNTQRPCTGPSCIDCSERRFDNCFGLGSRHKRCWTDAKRQAPEFLAADNARDRLSGQPALRQCGDRTFLLGIKTMRANGGEGGMIEA